MGPSESVFSYNTQKTPIPLVAIAGNLQKDTSAIISLKSHGIERPASMDGRKFASYDARFENDVVRQIVINDGGEGKLNISNPPMFSMWDSLLTGDVKTTWVLLP
ncbi:ABC transporter substrate-binding protein [Porifericola rhodea]|uniref:ABC transporter substrate-binding protein n=1 Tax=Porifericola rhodea TaxID=930972 RepID=UPI002666087F|nr:ABC transporter substrate-binding protein [Porifericola rhodea]WKN33936.1 ABC transporter substrate-binding protein [Porifericola rhodea]